jgi:hypothetical protein
VDGHSDYNSRIAGYQPAKHMTNREGRILSSVIQREGAKPALDRPFGLPTGQGLVCPIIDFQVEHLSYSIGRGATAKL